MTKEDVRKIAKEAERLYFGGYSIKEAIRKAKELYEGEMK